MGRALRRIVDLVYGALVESTSKLPHWQPSQENGLTEQR
jgi:hypothetical protein